MSIENPRGRRQIPCALCGRIIGPKESRYRVHWIPDGPLIYMGNAVVDSFHPDCYPRIRDLFAFVPDADVVD